MATGRELPGPTVEFVRFLSVPHPDWSDATAVIDYIVGYQRMLSGGRRPFDEAAARDLVRLDVERARDLVPVPAEAGTTSTSVTTLRGEASGSRTASKTAVIELEPWWASRDMRVRGTSGFARG